MSIHIQHFCLSSKKCESYQIHFSTSSKLCLYCFFSNSWTVCKPIHQNYHCCLVFAIFQVIVATLPCQIGKVIQFTVLTLSPWYIILLTLERFTAVFFPLKVYHWKYTLQDENIHVI